MNRVIVLRINGIASFHLSRSAQPMDLSRTSLECVFSYLFSYSTASQRASHRTVVCFPSRQKTAGYDMRYLGELRRIPRNAAHKADMPRASWNPKIPFSTRTGLNACCMGTIRLPMLMQCLLRLLGNLFLDLPTITQLLCDLWLGTKADNT